MSWLKEKMTWLKNFKWGFIIFCLIIAFFINRDCVDNDYADPDPLYGTSDRICSDEIDITNVLANAFGLYIFGYFSQYILNEEKKNDLA